MKFWKRPIEKLALKSDVMFDFIANCLCFRHSLIHCFSFKSLQNPQALGMILFEALGSSVNQLSSILTARFPPPEASNLLQLLRVDSPRLLAGTVRSDFWSSRSGSLRIHQQINTTLWRPGTEAVDCVVQCRTLLFAGSLPFPNLASEYLCIALGKKQIMKP